MNATEFRAWRTRLGWTQAIVADKLGVSVRAVKHYEAGTRRITPTIERLCERLRRRGTFWGGTGGKFVARADIKTPLRACRWLYETISSRYGDIRLVLDPCAGDGRMLKPWRDAGCITGWCEIKRGRDFFEQRDLAFKPDLVVCNPPFNGTRYKEWRLGSEAFLHKIFELCGERQRVALFTPMGLRLNVPRRGGRAEHLQHWNITSIVSLSRDFFGPNVMVHAEILLLNMPRLRRHYVLA